METLFNGFTLEIPSGAFPLSTDSMALADFVRLPRNARVLDLGSGCGTLGVLLCASDPAVCVTGIELDGAAHRTAIGNASRNGIAERLRSIHADLRDYRQQFQPGSFDVCISNPPYFTGGFPSAKLEQARQESSCTAEQLLDAAAWALKFGGDLYIVHKPERFAQLCALGAARNLEAKRICLVKHRKDSPVSMILLAFRKGGKPGLTWDEVCLFHDDGSPTADYQRIFHI